MKIYTKTGDKGSTSLFGGKRVSKDDIRIEAYGTVDELNSFVGLLHSVVEIDIVKKELIYIQSRLFDCGAILATDPGKDIVASKMEEKDYEILEKSIDRCNEELSPLQSFILPSGSNAVSIAHICRTVCRRAERRVISLQKTSVQLDEKIIVFLNRLSDYFFVLARYISLKSNVEEVKWEARKV